jgi:hypothetical protein
MDAHVIPQVTVAERSLPFDADDLAFIVVLFIEAWQ